MRDQLTIGAKKAIVGFQRVSWTSEAEIENTNFSWFLGEKSWPIKYLEWNTALGEPSNKVAEWTGYMNGNDNNLFHDIGIDTLGVLCQFGEPVIHLVISNRYFARYCKRL